LAEPGGYRAGKGRTAGFALALAAEALLVLLVLTLGSALTQPKRTPEIVDVVRFRASSEQNKAAAPKSEQPKHQQEQPKQRTEVEPQKTPPRPVPQPQQPLPKLIAIPPTQMAVANIAPSRPAAAPAPNRAQFGPADTSHGVGDTARVSGSGPHGEPLYAAAWYREPTDSELAGYLSTANGPGWGLIACRTAPDYHVEDCVALDESPSGSNIARAVLAAAWQFQVRPPRIGGQPKIGEWVRIRIDYGVRSR
jgi:protein TonB